MPVGPVRYKAPLPVRFKVNKGRLLFQKDPEVKIGKSIVAAQQQCVTAHHLETARRMLRKSLGKDKPFLMNVHATFARTKKSQGVKMGKGQGAISYFVARVSAGKPIITVPTLAKFPGVPANLYTLKCIVDIMPMACRLREQYNHFPEFRNPRPCIALGGNRVDGKQFESLKEVGGGASPPEVDESLRLQIESVPSTEDAEDAAERTTTGSEDTGTNLAAVADEEDVLAPSKTDALAPAARTAVHDPSASSTRSQDNLGVVKLKHRRHVSELGLESQRYGASTRGQCTEVARLNLSKTASRLAVGGIGGRLFAAAAGKELRRRFC
ncbi:unnamed protein product [Amoebophrya sp. A120]|nr:unnamed protein product [Amoebophrya sp. A120]|eukprot:GSA120T00010308001.1